MLKARTYSIQGSSELNSHLRDDFFSIFLL